jgi:1-aminocyclopropane-1-carboxylate deaminase/D-cysteine desulfhydrase-like pyridoxal-dependent ACC family enzyme
VRRFPALGRIPRARLGHFPTPVERVELPGAGELYLKRDDLAGDRLGGNKLRALEFLLGEVKPGDEVLTAGGLGSTHVLSTLHHARSLGARARAVRWWHEMNPVAERVRSRTSELAAGLDDRAGPVRALLLAYVVRVRGGAHWVPAGGSSPLGVLGHVNAGLELAEQVARGGSPEPDVLVVPLGTGGTAAGLALGLLLGGVRSQVLGARVVPRIAGSRWRVLRLADATARLIERHTGERLPRVGRERVRVVHDVYGGGYGRMLPQAERARTLLETMTDVRLDSTYSAKAFVAALAERRRRAGAILFWLTFDARWMQSPPGETIG